MKIAIAVTLSCALNAATTAAAERVVAVNSNNDPVTTISRDGLSPTQKAILAADEAWARAYQSCDLKLMDSVLHPDLMFIHAHARVDNKQSAMKQFATCSNEETIVEPLRVVVLSPNTGVIEAAMTIRAKGLAGSVQSLFTRVYVRDGSGWRLIAHQTTRNPGVDAAGKPLPNPAFQQPGAALATPAEIAR